MPLCCHTRCHHAIDYILRDAADAAFITPPILSPSAPLMSAFSAARHADTEYVVRHHIVVRDTEYALFSLY